MNASTEPTAASEARTRSRRLLAGSLAVLFGLATIVAGGRALLGAWAGDTSAGQIVPFVLVFNFVAGFAYLAAGAATLARRPWAIWLSRAIAAATLLVFAALAAHVLSGGAYEPRTVAAMVVRSTFWTVQALVLPGLLRRSADAA